MRIDIRGKNLRVSAGWRRHIEEKIGHLAHYLDNILDAHVTLRTERSEQIVDVTLNLKHYLIKAEERSADMYASIDMVRDRLEQQIRKYKTRTRERRHRPNGKLVSIAAATEVTEPTPKRRGQGIHVKQFAVKPMDPQDAATQMELLGHDFFVFLNAETEAVNVLYKRKNGDLGLLEPAL